LALWALIPLGEARGMACTFVAAKPPIAAWPTCPLAWEETFVRLENLQG
jgi:hypothetical protein